MSDRTRGRVHSRCQAAAGHLRRTVRVIAGAIVGAVLVRLLAEGLLYHPVGRYEHPALARTYKTGISVHGTEGFSWTRFAADGIRVPLAGEHDRSGFRVLCLGDSYTEGLQVWYSQTYPAVLEDTLEKRLDAPVACINAGSSGSAVAKYVACAGYYQHEFTPDVVIVQVSENDFASDTFNASLPFHAIETTAGLEIERGPALTPRPLLLRERVLGEGLCWLLDDRAAKRAKEEAGEAARPTTPAAGNAAEAPGDLPPLTDQEGEALDWSIHELADAYDVPVIVVYLPELDYPKVSADEPPRERALRESCRRWGVSYLDMRSAYVGHFEDTGEAAHGFANTTPGLGHINSTGHALVASAIADALIAGGVVR